MLRMRFRSRIPVPAELLFDWHAREGAFERLAPPWQRVDVVSRQGSIRDGDVLVMRVGAGPVSKKWVARHSDFEPGKQFRDTQVEGPFSSWSHLHRVHQAGDGQSILDDEVSLELPLHYISHRLAGDIARRQIQRMFRFRHLRTRLDVWRHHLHAGDRRHTVLVLGCHPLTSQMKAFVQGGGHVVVDNGDASAVIDLRHVTGGRQKPSFIEVLVFDSLPGNVPTRRLRITIPDVVIGQSFIRFPPFSVFGVPRSIASASRSSWVSEDDLIGLIYLALGQPLPDSTVQSDVATLQQLPGFQPAFLDASDAYRAQMGEYGKSCTIDV